jgi:branched-chain amino acid aminotransferase
VGVVWLNGELLDEARASLSVHDRGFLLGDGLFETLRVYDGRVFRLAAHLRRLRGGAARIALALPPGLDRAVRETVAASGVRDGAVRLTVSRGAGGEGLAAPAGAPPTVVVTVRPYRPVGAWYTAGIRAQLAAGRVDERRATAGLKQLGYLEAVVALAEARAAGCEDALFLDTAGHLAEGAASNLFLVAGGELWTPPLSCGVLPGITRAAVLELAAARGLAPREEPLPPQALAAAAEAFLTSSLRELVPLTAVGGRKVGDGVPGEVTLALLHDYRRLAHAAREEDGVHDH